jgi:hypothetical protein
VITKQEYQKILDNVDWHYQNKIGDEYIEGRKSYLLAASYSFASDEFLIMFNFELDWALS